LKLFLLNSHNFGLFVYISEITAKIFTGKNKRKWGR
jgi:hypothetical protein